MSGQESTVLFSAIMVCRNAAGTIDAAMASVHGQTWKDMELIVIDGGSTDGTIGKIEEWSRRFGGRMNWISEPDRGVYDAMNKGIARAHGKYLHFLNADDRYADERVLARVAAVAGEAVLVYGDVRFVDGRDGFSEVVAGGHRRIDFALSRGPHHQGSFFCAEAVRKAGGFRMDLGTACDLALMARLRAGYPGRFTRTGGVVADFSLGGLSERPDAFLRREMNRARAVGASLGFAAGALNFLHGISLWIRSWLRVGFDRVGWLTGWRRLKSRVRPGRYHVEGGR